MDQVHARLFLTGTPAWKSGMRQEGNARLPQCFPYFRMPSFSMIARYRMMSFFIR